MVKGSKKAEKVKSNNDSIESIIKKSMNYLEKAKKEENISKEVLFKEIKEIIKPKIVYVHSLSEESYATENQIVYHYFKNSDLNNKALKMLQELIEKN
jgi:hypothetical protein